MKPGRKPIDPAVVNILKQAEKDIRQLIGKKVQVSYRLTKKETMSTVQLVGPYSRSIPQLSNKVGEEFGLTGMMSVVANTLGLKLKDYAVVSRQVTYTHLRFIATMIARKHYPEVTLKELGWQFEKYGNRESKASAKHYSTVINMHTSGYNLLEKRDVVFCTKWVKVVEKLNEEVGKYEVKKL